MTHPKSSIPSLVITLASLMALLALSVIASRLEHGPTASAIALGIAAAKAIIVGWFFMDLRFKSPLTRVFAIAGLFWLVVMLVLTLCDFLTRGW